MHVYNDHAYPHYTDGGMFSKVQRFGMNLEHKSCLSIQIGSPAVPLLVIKTGGAKLLNSVVPDLAMVSTHITRIRAVPNLPSTIVVS